MAVLVRSIREEPLAGGPVYTHPEWADAMPWLAQGITGRAGGSIDMGLFGAVPTGEAQKRWRELREAMGCATAVHARQVHGARVLWHDGLPAGLVIAHDADGHVTTQSGQLLAISVADCVPVQLVDPNGRVAAGLHAGWRGVAAGVLEAGLTLIETRTGIAPRDLLIHFGPAICGPCYEVGPEVPEALGLERPDGKTHLDVRGTLVARALAAGAAADHVTVSEWCTRCGDSPFFSHRGGNAERQMSVIGIRR